MLSRWSRLHSWRWSAYRAQVRKIIRIKLDYDDGRWQYAGDIVYANVEYDYVEYDFETDAETSAFLEWSKEQR